MAAETAPRDVTRWGADRWQAIVGGGLIAGVVFGLTIHSVVSAGLFAWIVARSGLADGASSTGRWLGLGAVYGAVIWLVAAAFVMPAWLSMVGAAPAAASIPTINPQSLVGHLAYGLVLGLVYPKLG